MTRGRFWDIAPGGLRPANPTGRGGMRGPSGRLGIFIGGKPPLDWRGDRLGGGRIGPSPRIPVGGVPPGVPPGNGSAPRMPTGASANGLDVDMRWTAWAVLFARRAGVSSLLSRRCRAFCKSAAAAGWTSANCDSASWNCDDRRAGRTPRPDPMEPREVLELGRPARDAAAISRSAFATLVAAGEKEAPTPRPEASSQSSSSSFPAAAKCDVITAMMKPRNIERMTIPVAMLTVSPPRPDGQSGSIAVDAEATGTVGGSVGAAVGLLLVAVVVAVVVCEVVTVLRRQPENSSVRCPSTTSLR